MFKDYGNPTFLLDGVISSGQFCAWLDAQYENKEEETMWEYYIHKLGAWDNRSFDEFRQGIKTKQSYVPPSKEQTSATINKSYNLIKQFEFEILEERG